MFEIFTLIYILHNRWSAEPLVKPGAIFISGQIIQVEITNQFVKLIRFYNNAKISQSSRKDQLVAILLKFTITSGQKVNFINVKLTTFMCVSGKSRGRLAAPTAEATTTNNEQSVNKDTADIFSSTTSLRPLACNCSEPKALAMWWRRIYLKAEMISRGYTFFLCQLVTCLWRPSTNKKSSLPREKILIRLWSKIGIQEIILETRMRCKKFDYVYSRFCQFVAKNEMGPHYAWSLAYKKSALKKWKGCK